MSKLTPFGKPGDRAFTNVKAFLHHIAEDEAIDGFAMVVFRKDGTAQTATINCARERVAFAGVALQSDAISDE